MDCRPIRHQIKLKMGICIQPPWGSSAAAASNAPRKNSANKLTPLLSLVDCRSIKVILRKIFSGVVAQAGCESVLGQHAEPQIQFRRSQLTHPSLALGQDAE